MFLISINVRKENQHVQKPSYKQNARAIQKWLSLLPFKNGLVSSPSESLHSGRTETLATVKHRSCNAEVHTKGGRTQTFDTSCVV